eukprot:4744874-Amphidinium_carterae.1
MPAAAASQDESFSPSISCAYDLKPASPVCTSEHALWAVLPPFARQFNLCGPSLPDEECAPQAANEKR